MYGLRPKQTCLWVTTNVYLLNKWNSIILRLLQMFGMYSLMYATLEKQSVILSTFCLWFFVFVFVFFVERRSSFLMCLLFSAVWLEQLELPLKWAGMLLEMCFGLGMYHDSSTPHMLPLMEAEADIDKKLQPKLLLKENNESNTPLYIITIC